MIQINLALKKQAVGAGVGAVTDSSRGTGTQLTLSRFTANFGELKDLPIGKIVVPVVIALLATLGIDWYKDSRIKSLEVRMEELGQEKGKLNQKLEKYKGLVEVKNTIERDMAAIRIKKAAIDLLIAGRGIAPRMLLALAGGTPKEVWLTEFKVKDSEVGVKGMSLGFAQVSDFMRGMGDTAFFTDVQVKQTEQKKDETGAEVAAFELVAKRRKEEGGAK